MTITPHQPDRFAFATFTGMNPVFVTEDTPCDDLHTTYAFALHVKVPAAFGSQRSAASDFFDRVLSTVPVGTFPWLRAEVDDTTPAATGGDSFAGWCEPYGYGGEDDSYALHLYFSSPSLEIARNLALAFAVRIGLTRFDVALSTAGDWAEQTTIPEAP